MPAGFASSSAAGRCPCGRGIYRSCCEPLHRGEKRAETAEQLMRSRYSAFVLAEVEYLLATHPEPDRDETVRRNELMRSCRQTRWQGLKIRDVQGGGCDDMEGTVMFEARYRGGVLKETSLFQRRNGSPEGDWLYVRAVALEV